MIITGPRKMFERRVKQRGYSLEEVMPCVIAQDGDQWTVDITHLAYPTTSRKSTSKVKHSRKPVPGTHLYNLLKRFGIREEEGCKCDERKKLMNLMGPDWCTDNIDTIVSWLREDAEKRGLPFIEIIVKLLIKRAIRKSR